MYVEFKISRELSVSSTEQLKELVSAYIEHFQNIGFDVDTIVAGESLRAVMTEGSEI